MNTKIQCQLTVQKAGFWAPVHHKITSETLSERQLTLIEIMSAVISSTVAYHALQTDFTIFFFPWLLVNLDLQYPGTTSSIFHLWNCSPGTLTLSSPKWTLSISKFFQLSSGYLKSFYIWIEMTVLGTSSSIKSTLSTTVSGHLYR